MTEQAQNGQAPELEHEPPAAVVEVGVGIGKVGGETMVAVNMNSTRLLTVEQAETLAAELTKLAAGARAMNGPELTIASAEDIAALRGAHRG